MPSFYFPIFVSIFQESPPPPPCKSDFSLRDFWLFPLHLLPHPLRLRAYCTGGHKGTAAGDRPAEITVLLLESIQPGSTQPIPVRCVCLPAIVKVCAPNPRQRHQWQISKDKSGSAINRKAQDLIYVAYLPIPSIYASARFSCSHAPVISGK